MFYCVYVFSFVDFLIVKFVVSFFVEKIGEDVLCFGME